MKKFISGLVVGIMLMSVTPIMAETQQSINAIFGRVKLVVNNKSVQQETLLFNGTTYVPLRATAEILGKEVSYDNNSSTAYIDEKGTNRKISSVSSTNNTTPANNITFNDVNVSDLIGSWNGLYVYNSSTNKLEKVNVSSMDCKYTFLSNGTFTKETPDNQYIKGNIYKGEYELIDDQLYLITTSKDGKDYSSNTSWKVKISSDKKTLYTFGSGSNGQEVINGYIK